MSFPKEVVEHYVKWNGGRPQRPLFRNVDFDEIEVSEFLPMMVAPRSPNGSSLLMEEAATDGWRSNRLPRNLVPFAIDWGDNYFCVDVDTRKIY